jgi:hypothetical protein
MLMTNCFVFISCTEMGVQIRAENIFSQIAYRANKKEVIAPNIDYYLFPPP